MTIDRSRRIVLATRNEDKVKEILEIFNGFPAEIVGLDGYPSAPEVDETGSTLEENALLKARSAWGATGETSMADDSGLFVDALEGRPGVHSSRFAGECATYADNNEKLLEMLNGRPPDERGASFVCLVAIVIGEEEYRLFKGEVTGRIISGTRGVGGFGYDPLFFHPESGRTFAELNRAEKNRISHRFLAFSAARKYLEEVLDDQPLDP